MAAVAYTEAYTEAYTAVVAAAEIQKILSYQVPLKTAETLEAAVAVAAVAVADLVA